MGMLRHMVKRDLGTGGQGEGERCWDWGTGRRDVTGDLEARGSEVMETDWEGWGSSNRITGVSGTMLG